MELMLLVYSIENLTYNTTFFMTIFKLLFTLTLLLILIRGVVSIYNKNQHVVHKVIKPKIYLNSGDVFKLKEDFLKFKANEEYVITDIYKNIGHFYSEDSKGSRMGCCEALLALQNKLSEQEAETKVIEPKLFQLPNLPIKTLLSVSLACLLLHTFLPTRQTAIYMAGAYIVQEVVTADKTQELGNKAYGAAIAQLNKWAEEVPELVDIASDAGLKLVKDKVEEVSK